MSKVRRSTLEHFLYTGLCSCVHGRINMISQTRCKRVKYQTSWLHTAKPEFQQRKGAYFRVEDVSMSRRQKVYAQLRKSRLFYWKSFLLLPLKDCYILAGRETEDVGQMNGKQEAWQLERAWATDYKGNGLSEKAGNSCRTLETSRN